MRRGQFSKLTSQTSEPRIVVDEQENEDASGSQQSIDDDPSINPYLLSPYGREFRKHSLPTPQCSGITASQVRRLSERGESSPGPKQAEFLATLSQAPQPTPGGRRHSVVTISKLPQTVFGKIRRESIAVPTSTAFRVLPNRRESIACPPSTESRGSIHNLQLDIMDDIVQARKVRIKVWNDSKEKLCEVESIDEAGAVERYAKSSRRFSDFIGTTLPPIKSSTKRRASELPQPQVSNTSNIISSSSSSTSSSKLKSGIVCSNTDLISILCSLSTSAMEIDQLETKVTPMPISTTTEPRSERMGRFTSRRSNSFDISILQPHDAATHELKATNSPSQWFTKRHQPISKNKHNESNKGVNTDINNKVIESEPGKVIWDEKSGSLVDACALGSAIEGFLRQSSPDQNNQTNKVKKNCLKLIPAQQLSGPLKLEQESADTCDSSLCSTLKDLFVK